MPKKKPKTPTLEKAARAVIDAEGELHNFPYDAEEVYPDLCAAIKNLRRAMGDEVWGDE